MNNQCSLDKHVQTPPPITMHVLLSLKTELLRTGSGSIQLDVC